MDIRSGNEATKRDKRVKINAWGDLLMSARNLRMVDTVPRWGSKSTAEWSFKKVALLGPVQKGMQLIFAELAVSAQRTGEHLCRNHM